MKAIVVTAYYGESISPNDVYVFSENNIKDVTKKIKKIFNNVGINFEEDIHTFDDAKKKYESNLKEEDDFDPEVAWCEKEITLENINKSRWLTVLTYNSDIEVNIFLKEIDDKRF